MTRPRIIAIDGPAGSGKSTVARAVASRLGLPYIDTGAMYRAVALHALDRGIDCADEARLTELAASLDFSFLPGIGGIRINGEAPGDRLRAPEVSQAASRVSLVSGVRSALRESQRRLGRERGCVMEGRDIGTIVFPDASVKLFLTASPAERARRRAAELAARGVDASLAGVRAEIEDRDRRDREREIAPMKPAADALLIETEGRSIEEIVDRIVALAGEPGS